MKRDPKTKNCEICKNEFTQFRRTQTVCGYECALKKADKSKKKRSKERKQLNSTKTQDEKKKRLKSLQMEVNKLARLIDKRFGLGCIDCNSQVKGVGNGAHYHNVGGNETIRFNLHNIHLSRIYCNKYSSEHKKGYKEGLIDRYGLDYYNKVENELMQIEPLHLTLEDVKQALKKVRKINREFDSYKLESPILSREFFNKAIGLYKT